MSRLAILAALLSATAACAQTEPPVLPDPANDSCGAAGFAGLIGQSGEIARMLELDQPVRILGPGDAMTMDFRPNRINFMLDSDGRIARIQCV